MFADIAVFLIIIVLMLLGRAQLALQKKVLSHATALGFAGERLDVLSDEIDSLNGDLKKALGLPYRDASPIQAAPSVAPGSQGESGHAFTGHPHHIRPLPDSEPVV